jgi:S-adenosylmethionine hydrolase
MHIRGSFIVLLLLFFPFLSYAAQPTIVFMSDFGTTDDSVAICKGVMIRIEPDARIIDLTHQVKPYSILDAARFLSGTAPYYSAGTVFVAVVDPGVGSIRKPIVVKSKKGHYYVLPDNGLITLVEEIDGIEGIREINNTDWMIGTAFSSTFHGRDIFAPVAAHLASGKDWKDAGPELNEHVRLNFHRPEMNGDGLSGEVIALDGPFGNLVTNIPAELFYKLKYSLGETIRARIGERDFTIPLVKTFSDVEIGKPLFFVDSRSRIGVAVNQGNFAEVYKITPPTSIMIYAKK